MRQHRFFTVLFLAGLGLGLEASAVSATGALAAERPTTVSPGSATGLRIGDACPTFSWGAVAGAKGYELVVYRLEAEGEEAQQVLSQRIAGPALGWTPSLDRCLERGTRYAWSVRAFAGKGSGEWSPLRLFKVASISDDAKLEEALETLRSYLPQLAEAVAASEALVGRATSSSRGAQPPDAVTVPGTGIVVNGEVVISGWEVKSTGYTSCSAGTVCTKTAHCDPGKKVLGGGVQSQFPQNCEVVGSHPITPDISQWRGVVRAIANNCDIQAWALCAVVE